MIIPDKDPQGNIVQHHGNVRYDENFRVRHTGIFKSTIAAYTLTDLDWKIPQLQWQATNVPSVMVGVRFQVVGGENVNPPEVDFSVVDVDGVYYPAGTVLDKFADGFYMFTGEKSELREHKADLVTDLYIRAHVNNVGNQSVTFICNLLRYIDTSGV